LSGHFKKDSVVTLGHDNEATLTVVS